jgi:hypothetical protein
MPFYKFEDEEHIDTGLFYIENIREGRNLGNISIALCRTDATKPPSHVYEIHNDGGIIQTYVRELDDFREDRWKHQFDVEPGKACSIEFNGYWVLDSLNRYNLITEDKPYIFWTDNNNVLYVQKWDDVSTRIQLSSDVVKVASIRGWRNVEETAVDQGLICAYIKTDGNVYYRNYCEQLDGSYMWEYEKLISQFTPPITNLGLFRTNDYRTGFIVESNGSVSWLLTSRAWAGMAVQPENISVGLNDYAITIYPVEYSNANENGVENISAGLTEYFIGYAVPIYPAVTSITNSDEHTITLKFNYPITQRLIGLESAFTVSDSIGTIFAVASTSAGIDQTEIVLNVSNFSSAKNDMSVAYDSSIAWLSCENNGLQFAIDSFTSLFTADIVPPEGYANENVSVGMTNYIIAPKQVFYSSTNNNGSENIRIGFAGYSIVVTKVGTNPL